MSAATDPWGRTSDSQNLTLTRKSCNFPRMKTTLDLPADLVREMKLRAEQMGCMVEDVATDLLKRALAPAKSAGSAPFAMKGMIKLPLFPSPNSAPASRMSTAELLALEQKTLHQEDLQRLGLSL
jgi:plasmid stability protein